MRFCSVLLLVRIGVLVTMLLLSSGAIVGVGSSTTWANTVSYSSTQDLYYWFPETNARSAWKALESQPILVLKEFKPVGAEFSDFELRDTRPAPMLSFTATPASLIARAAARSLNLPANFRVSGQLFASEHLCDQDSQRVVGTLMTFDLSQSQGSVSDDIAKIEFKFCPRLRQDDVLELLGKSRLVHGPNFGRGPLGNQVKEFVQWQIWPFWRAIATAHKKLTL